jgi:hypothetical protein
MAQKIDDFTIVLSEWTDMAECELKVYEGLDRLWRMLERYKMTAPIAIRVLDNKARCVRAIRGSRSEAAGWQLEDEPTAVTPHIETEVEPPLTLNVQDAKGNVLKMRLQLGVVKPEPLSTHSFD